MQRRKLSRKFCKIKKIGLSRLIVSKESPVQSIDNIHGKEYTLEISKY